MSDSNTAVPEAVAAAVAQAIGPTDKIVANIYLNLITDPDTGETRPFGKLGYQTMHKDAGKYVLMNMGSCSRSMAAGELLDVNGDIATDGAVVECYAILTKVKPDSEVEQVATIRTLGGKQAAVPAAPVAVPGQPSAFGG